MHVRATFLELHVNSVQPLPTSRADREPPKGLGWGYRVRVRVKVKVKVRVGFGVGLVWAA